MTSESLILMHVEREMRQNKYNVHKTYYNAATAHHDLINLSHHTFSIVSFFFYSYTKYDFLITQKCNQYYTFKYILSISLAEINLMKDKC